MTKSLLSTYRSVVGAVPEAAVAGLSYEEWPHEVEWAWQGFRLGYEHRSGEIDPGVAAASALIESHWLNMCVRMSKVGVRLVFNVSEDQYYATADNGDSLITCPGQSRVESLGRCVVWSQCKNIQ